MFFPERCIGHLLKHSEHGPVVHVVSIDHGVPAFRGAVPLKENAAGCAPYPKSEEKAITKTNNLSAKAGATNVTSNNGYVGGLFGGFHPSSMRVLRKPSISGGMVSSGCCTGWEGPA